MAMALVALKDLPLDIKIKIICQAIYIPKVLRKKSTLVYC